MIRSRFGDERIGGHNPPLLLHILLEGGFVVAVVVIFDDSGNPLAKGLNNKRFGCRKAVVHVARPKEGFGAICQECFLSSSAGLLFAFAQVDVLRNVQLLCS